MAANYPEESSDYCNGQKKLIKYVEHMLNFTKYLKVEIFNDEVFDKQNTSKYGPIVEQINEFGQKDQR